MDDYRWVVWAALGPGLLVLLGSIAWQAAKGRKKGDE